MLETDADRADPGTRAAARLQRVRAGDKKRRIASAVGLGVMAAATPVVAASTTGDSGATVGAIIAALTFVAFAVTIWPYDWSDEERRHHELESIWLEARTDAAEATPWERYVAWASPRDASVQLMLITCAPARERSGGAPSPYGSEVVRVLDAYQMAEAAQAMDALRADASSRELEARQRHHSEQHEAEDQAHARVLRDIDQAAAADVKARGDELRREMAEQEAAERQTQAESVAKALRRS